MSNAVNVQGKNRLIELLSPEDRELVLSNAERLPLKRGDILFDVGQKIDYAFFPVASILSIVLPMADDVIVEIATAGNEGMVGISLLHGDDIATSRAMCQVVGEAHRISAENLKTCIARSHAFAAVLGKHAQAFIAQIGQSAACNRLHPVEQRFARWMLLSQDRVGGDDIPLAQEFLAQMLGVRRQSVSVVVAMFQKAGFLWYSRGVIHILDRKGLESAACECYRNVQRFYERALVAPEADTAR